MRDGHFDPDVYKHARISPELRVINKPIGTQLSCSERGKSQDSGLVTGTLFFSSPRLAVRAKCRVLLAWLIKCLLGTDH